MEGELVIFIFGILSAGILYLSNEILKLRRQMKESKEVLEEYERLFRSELKSLRNRIHS